MNTLNSDIETLRERGYIEGYDMGKFNELDKTGLIKLLHDEFPVHRSAAAKIIRAKCNVDEVEMANILLEQLYKEKKLYTRLEICTTLESGNIITAKEMIPYIGKIGNNQHKTLPERPSLKSSYPLPRDLIVRSLARMKRDIMPVLMDALRSGETDKIREILDAIGFLTFYDRKAASVEYINKIIDTIEKFKNDKIITWKGIICLSSFPFVQSTKYLKEICENSKNELFVQEAKRAINLMFKNK